MATKKRKTVPKSLDQSSRPRYHCAVLACSKNGQISQMWTRENDDEDLIESVQGFVSYSQKMKKLKSDEEKKTIIVLRGDGVLMTLGDTATLSVEMPKNRKAVIDALECGGFISRRKK